MLSGKKGVRAAGERVISIAMPELLEQISRLYDYVIADTPLIALAPDAEYPAGHCDASIPVARQRPERIQLSPGVRRTGYHSASGQ